jgi:hypothetical protein
MPKEDITVIHCRPYYIEAMKGWYRCCWIEVPISTPKMDVLAAH